MTLWQTKWKCVCFLIWCDKNALWSFPCIVTLIHCAGRTKGGVSLRCSFPLLDLTCQVNTAELGNRLTTESPAGNWKKTAPWTLQGRIPPPERVFTDWRSRRRPGTSRRDTRRCGPSAPEPTGPSGEFTRKVGARLQEYWRGRCLRVYVSLFVQQGAGYLAF